MELDDELKGLIAQNPFCERILFLLANPQLATTPVLNTKGRLSPPNCIGTAFFVAGVSSLPYPYHGYGFELYPHMRQPDQKWDDFFFPHPERRIPGAFVFSYCIEIEDWHAGIYLGETRQGHILFAQRGHAEEFALETLSGNYSNPDYYIPTTLMKGSNP